MITHSNVHRQTTTSLPIVSSIVSPRRDRIRSMPMKEKILTTGEEEEFKVRDDEPDVDPRGALEKLLDVTHNAVVLQGRITNQQSQ